MAQLVVNNLTKKFGSFKVVDDISFALEEGEVLGFLGPTHASLTWNLSVKENLHGVKLFQVLFHQVIYLRQHVN